MPIKKKTINPFAPPASAAEPPLPAYEPPRAPIAPAGLPAISSRDLNYFANLAASLYADAPLDGNVDDPQPVAGSVDVDASAVLVLRLFRQTATHVRPVAERFHLGPADRQPLYALTAQPSPRSADEFNELVVKRRDAITGVWHGVCTADLEPRLDMSRPGHYKVASLVMDAVPVWRRVVGGRVTFEAGDSGLGNKLCLFWGDRRTLGPIGDAYGLWWESGGETGRTEAFYVVERWTGFESSAPGVVRVKPARRNADGTFVDPHTVPQDLAALYFHNDGKTATQFVCQDVLTQIRLDFIMAGLMTVLVLETRKQEAAYNVGAQMANSMGLNYYTQ